jgi:hypothetical protein
MANGSRLGTATVDSVQTYTVLIRLPCIVELSQTHWSKRSIYEFPEMDLQLRLACRGGRNAREKLAPLASRMVARSSPPTRVTPRWARAVSITRAKSRLWTGVAPFARALDA